MVRNKKVNHVVIADGHLFFRRGLRALLDAEADFKVVDEAGDAADALVKVRMRQPHVLVMDLELLGGRSAVSGFDLRQAHPELAILFLTEQDDDRRLASAVSAGARGYMLKRTAAPELIAGIRQVTGTIEEAGTSGGLSKVVPDLKALAESNERSKNPNALTSREQEIIRLLAEGLTVRATAAELNLSMKTVEAHKLNLMRKLDIHNRSNLVQYAVQAGLVQTVRAR
ncbi:MAG: response regulator transcription factor [Acidobacteriaceae bacterium]|nr:response regulator transcription factor [Acidobacteriaceae bacterium]